MGVPRRGRPGLLVLAMFVAVGLACAGFPSPGEPTPVSLTIQGTRALTDNDASYRSPAWSTDGRTIAALRSQMALDPAGSPSTEGDVVLIDVASGDRQVIAPSPIVKPERAGGPVIWLAVGKEIAFYYFDFMGGQQTPLILRYNLETEDSEPIEVCCAPLLAAPDDTQLLVYTSSNGSFGIGWLDLDTGQVSEELSLPRESPREHQYVDFSLSPDGKSLLMGDADGRVFTYKVGSGVAPTLILSPATDPSWSPEGSKLAYASLSAFDASYYYGQLMIANADGSSPEPLFPETQPVGMLSPAWSPDGTQIAFLYGTRHSNALLIADVPESLRP